MVRRSRRDSLRSPRKQLQLRTAKLRGLRQPCHRRGGLDAKRVGILWCGGKLGQALRGRILILCHQQLCSVEPETERRFPRSCIRKRLEEHKSFRGGARLFKKRRRL